MNNFINIKKEIIEEASKCLNCKSKPCMNACPMGNDIPSFIMHLKNNDITKASQVLSKTTNLPLICSLVCQHELQCEGSCTLGKKKDPIKISMLEHYVANFIEIKRKNNPLNYKVAIIGSGPSGISCAKELYKMGISPSIYEKRNECGGVLTYGIPDFRLPYEYVLKEINTLKEMNVQIITNCEVGKDISFDVLYNMYDAIYIANGVDKSITLDIKGKNSQNVFSGLDFLNIYNQKKLNHNYINPLTNINNVSIIGCGNVAIDCARCAKKMGIKDVNIYYRRTENEMPASKYEYNNAKNEGIKFNFLTNPSKIITKDNKVTGLTLVKMKLDNLDSSNRRSPIVIKNSEFSVDTDCVIIAIGNRGNIDFFPSNLNTFNSLIKVNDKCFTSIPKVFAGGDIVKGAHTVSNANKDGIIAANSIYDFLTNK